MYTDKYKDWRMEELCKAEKEILMTMKEIRKERRDDEENGLDHDQTDQYKDCVMTLCYIIKTKLHAQEMNSKIHMMQTPQNSPMHSHIAHAA